LAFALLGLWHGAAGMHEGLSDVQTYLGMRIQLMGRATRPGNAKRPARTTLGANRLWFLWPRLQRVVLPL